jgi:hypothetical protein
MYSGVPRMLGIVRKMMGGEQGIELYNQNNELEWWWR